jgi:hypothetical protein
MESLDALEQERPMDSTTFHVRVSCERGYVTYSRPENSIDEMASFVYRGHLRKRMGTQGDVPDLGSHLGV